MNRILLFLIGFSFAMLGLHAQSEELKQLMDAYKETLAEEYDAKYFNLKPRDIGRVLETEHNFHEFFQLRSKKKIPNAFGKNQKLKIYLNVISYDSEYVLENAIRFWFKNFHLDQEIRPGRKVKSYEGANPMYVIIIGTHVIIMDIDCNGYTEEQWEKLTKDMRSFFDPNKEAIIIELLCNGPLEWVQNAPDFRKR
ncbi:MAG: hypothetical protein JJU02_00705 [Cryomorphaceae bacterium]|nr:hypothetical protein [Cryomorphaceae bacterium]